MERTAEQQADINTRMICLNAAMALHNHADFGGPAGVIDTLREIYLFLSGRDPVIDMGVTEGPHEGEDGHVCDVYYLDHFRGLKPTDE